MDTTPCLFAPANLCDCDGIPICTLAVPSSHGLPAVILYNPGDGAQAWSRFQDNEYRRVSFADLTQGGGHE